MSRRFGASSTTRFPTTGTATAGPAQIAVGTMVRVDLHGRRVAGWVTALDPDRDPSVELRPLTRLSGVGPPPDLVELARWAAWRWAGAAVCLPAHGESAHDGGERVEPTARPSGIDGVSPTWAARGVRRRADRSCGYRRWAIDGR